MEVLEKKRTLLFERTKRHLPFSLCTDSWGMPQKTHSQKKETDEKRRVQRIYLYLGKNVI